MYSIKFNLLINDLSNILFLIGSFLGAIGFFNLKNLSLYQRCQMRFFHFKYFKYALEQKYSEIFAFIFIFIGSLVKLSENLFEINFTFIVSKKILYLSICFTIIITITILCIIIIKIFSSYIYKKYNICLHYDDYCRSKKSNTTYEYSLKSLSELLKINSDVEDNVICIAKKFCEKHKKLFDLVKHKN